MGTFHVVLLLLLIWVTLLGCQPDVASSLPPRPDPASNSTNRTSIVNTVASPSAQQSAASRATILLADRATASGVNFAYRNGEETGNLAILESLGGGVGIIDFDQDGDLDLFFPGGGSFDDNCRPVGRSGELFRQFEPWKFTPVTLPAGLTTGARYTHGAAVADANNDGFPDLLITGYGGLEFYYSNGDGTFTEAAELSGLNDRLWSSSAAWGDLNADGSPDVYVAHYVNWSPENHPACMSVKGDRPDICAPRQFDPLPDTLYFGSGDGTYHDVSSASGLSTVGKGLGVLIADLDWDGEQDVYVANDTVPNFLYRNAGDGRLEDISDASGTAVNDRGLPDGSMGVDVGDFNMDSLPDLWVSNYERESFALYRNVGSSIFRHVSQSVGITSVGSGFVGWGTVFLDLDCDGDEDVFVSNGHVVHFPETAPVNQVPIVFENLAGKQMSNVADSGDGWTASAHPGRGCAAGDLDLDGDLDLAVSLVNEPVALLRNETQTDNHWLQLRLIGTVSCRDAFGARVIVETNSGRRIRQVKGGASYASTSDACLHFGLGDTELLTSVDILWPSGVIQTLTDIVVDQRHIVREPPRTSAIVP